MIDRDDFGITTATDTSPRRDIRCPWCKAKAGEITKNFTGSIWIRCRKCSSMYAISQGEVPKQELTPTAV